MSVFPSFKYYISQHFVGGNILLPEISKSQNLMQVEPYSVVETL